MSLAQLVVPLNTFLAGWLAGKLICDPSTIFLDYLGRKKLWDWARVSRNPDGSLAAPVDGSFRQGLFLCPACVGLWCSMPVAAGNVIAVGGVTVGQGVSTWVLAVLGGYFMHVYWLGKQVSF